LSWNREPIGDRKRVRNNPVTKHIVIHCREQALTASIGKCSPTDIRTLIVACTRSDCEQADALLKRAHCRRRWRLDMIAAFFGTIDGTVTDVFCGHQMKFLNVMQDFAIFQAFIFRVVPSFAMFTRRGYHSFFPS
jgi:hypothetical protein